MTSASSETPHPPPPPSFGLLRTGSPAPGGRPRRQPGARATGVPLHATRRLDRGVQEALDTSTGLSTSLGEGDDPSTSSGRVSSNWRAISARRTPAQHACAVCPCQASRLGSLPRIGRFERIFLRGLPRIRRIERIFFLHSCNSRNSRQEAGQRVAQACTEHRRSSVVALLECAQAACPGRRLRVELADPSAKLRTGVVDADGDVGHGFSGWGACVCE